MRIQGPHSASQWEGSIFPPVGEGHAPCSPVALPACSPLPPESWKPRGSLPSLGFSKPLLMVGPLLLPRLRIPLVNSPGGELRKETGLFFLNTALLPTQPQPGVGPATTQGSCPAMSLTLCVRADWDQVNWHSVVLPRLEGKGGKQAIDPSVSRLLKNECPVLGPREPRSLSGLDFCLPKAHLSARNMAHCSRTGFYLGPPKPPSLHRFGTKSSARVHMDLALFPKH